MLGVRLYLAFLKIGLLGFGGGYMMIPLFFLDIVEQNGWLNHDQMFNIVALAQTVPGTFATNTAAMVGMNMGGAAYAVVAVLGIITPALAIAYFADRFILPYLGRPQVQGILKGITGAVVGIILGTGLNMAGQAVNDLPTLLIAATSFALFFKKGWNAALSMVSAALAGTVLLCLL